jgi:hypothetical protein
MADGASPRRRRYCALMLANFTTFAHFSISAVIRLVKSAGVIESGVTPNSLILALICESASPALVSLLSFSMISPGVFLGANSRYKLAYRWKVRERFQACRAGHRKRAYTIFSDMFDRGRCRIEQDLHLPFPEGRHRGDAALQRHVRHARPGHHLEKCAYQAGAAVKQPQQLFALGLVLIGFMAATARGDGDRSPSGTRCRARPKVRRRTAGRSIASR